MSNNEQETVSFTDYFVESEIIRKELLSFGCKQISLNSVYVSGELFDLRFEFKDYQFFVQVKFFDTRSNRCIFFAEQLKDKKFFYKNINMFHNEKKDLYFIEYSDLKEILFNVG